MSVVNFHTKSGSVYQVDRAAKMMCAIKKADHPDGGPNHAKRTGDGEWREYESFDYQGIGHPIYFWWGSGRDEHSGTATQIGEGPESSVRRATWTSPVVRTELVT